MNAPDFGVVVAVKATVLLALAFGLGFVLRKDSASARHFLWTVAFACLVAIPPLTYLSLSSDSIRIPVALLAPEPTPSPASGIVNDVPERAAPERRAPERGTQAAAPASSWEWSRLARRSWIVGALVLLVRLGTGLATSARVRRLSEEISDPAWHDLLDGARDQLRLRRAVDIRFSDDTELPMTIGFSRPAVLLPRGAEDYDAARRSAVLLHELAHVKRRDCSSQVLAQLVCALFWWNPLAWLAARHMRLLSERASDDLVLEAGANPSDYAHDLLEMARSLHRERITPLASVTMAHRSRFEERLLAILDPNMVRSAVSSRVVVLMAAASVPLVGALSLAVPTKAYRESPPQADRSPLIEEPEQETSALEPSQDSEQPAQEEPTETRASEPASDVARKALAEALEDEEASVREQALEALIQLEDPTVVPHLKQALGNDDPEIRAKAAWGLGHFGQEDAGAALVEALRDENAAVREQAAWALGQIESVTAVEGLVRALEDADANVREQAAWALGQIESATAVEGLLRALSDADANVREQAAWALGQIESATAVEGLVRALEDADANVREQAAWALGMIENEQAVEGLARALRDSDDNVREQAVWALGMIQSRNSVEALVGALADGRADVRSQAAWALGMIGDSQAVEALSRALKDEDADVREQAAWALGQIAGDHDGGNPNPNPDPNPNPNPNPRPNPNPNPNPDPSPNPKIEVGVKRDFREKGRGVSPLKGAVL